VLHDSPCDLVLKDGGFVGTAAYGYLSTSLAGSLYIEDFGALQVNISKPGQQVWARQFNPEGDAVRAWNSGGIFWILGIKIENTNNLIITENGGKTEILGAYVYSVVTTLPNVPAFININSQLSISSCFQLVYDTSSRYTILVLEELNGKVATLNHTNVLQYGYGDYIPLYSSVQSSTNPTASSTSTKSPTSSTTKLSTSTTSGTTEKSLTTSTTKSATTKSPSTSSTTKSSTTTTSSKASSTTTGKASAGTDYSSDDSSDISSTSSDPSSSSTTAADSLISSANAVVFGCIWMYSLYFLLGFF